MQVLEHEPSEIVNLLFRTKLNDRLALEVSLYGLENLEHIQCESIKEMINKIKLILKYNPKIRMEGNP